MRAGLLRETVDFYGTTKAQRASGFVSKTEAKAATVRCYRKKRMDALAMAGKEEFNAGTVQLQVRNDPRIIDATRFVYEGCKYNIEQNLLQLDDNTRLVTGINDNT